MFGLLDKLRGKDAIEPEPKEARCTCGGSVMIIPNEGKDLYLCKCCNKLLYYIEIPPLPKVRPLSLGFIKRKK
ncbi:MAG: hypothetical protein PHS52_07325 [Desulfotomaculaceae bacterium]|nr:hypothetical protein [Desulfotomaculaceae bacterium]